MFSLYTVFANGKKQERESVMIWNKQKFCAACMTMHGMKRCVNKHMIELFRIRLYVSKGSKGIGPSRYMALWWNLKWNCLLFSVKLFMKRRIEKGKKQYKITKLLFGILSIALITVVLTTTEDALENERETSGGVGVLVAGILGLTVHSRLFGGVFGFWLILSKKQDHNELRLYENEVLCFCNGNLIRRRKWVSVHIDEFVEIFRIDLCFIIILNLKGLHLWHGIKLSYKVFSSNTYSKREMLVLRENIGIVFGFVHYLFYCVFQKFVI